MYDHRLRQTTGIRFGDIAEPDSPRTSSPATRSSRRSRCCSRQHPVPPMAKHSTWAPSCQSILSSANISLPSPRPPFASPRRTRAARMEEIARHFPFPADQVVRQNHWLRCRAARFIRVYRPGPVACPWSLCTVADGSREVDARRRMRRLRRRQHGRRQRQYRQCGSPFRAQRRRVRRIAMAPGLQRTWHRRVTLRSRATARGAHLHSGRPSRPVIAADADCCESVLSVSLTTSKPPATSSMRTRAYPGGHDQYWNHYLPGGIAQGDHRALRCERRYADCHIPIVVAGLDPLHDECLVGRAIAPAGSMRLVDEPTLVHGFLRASRSSGVRAKYGWRNRGRGGAASGRRNFRANANGSGPESVVTGDDVAKRCWSPRHAAGGPRRVALNGRVGPLIRIKHVMNPFRGPGRW